MKIYLDHNILDEISKNRMELEAPDDTVWVYSDESFNEIKRANDMRFLDVLKNLKARKLELELDNQFRLTGAHFFIIIVSQKICISSGLITSVKSMLMSSCNHKCSSWRG